MAMILNVRTVTYNTGVLEVKKCHKTLKMTQIQTQNK